MRVLLAAVTVSCLVLSACSERVATVSLPWETAVDSTRDPIAYDVYSADGALLGRVKLPPRTNVFRVRGDFAWGISRNEDDVEFATRFRVTPSFGEPR